MTPDEMYKLREEVEYNKDYDHTYSTDLVLSLLDTIDRLTKQNTVMKEAITFYGNKENWSLTGSLKNIREFRALNSYGEALNDVEDFQELNTLGYKEDGKFYTYKIAGKRARQALKEVEGLSL